jgi:hypothetical protein
MKRERLQSQTNDPRTRVLSPEEIDAVALYVVEQIALKA